MYFMKEVHKLHIGDFFMTLNEFPYLNIRVEKIIFLNKSVSVIFSVKSELVLPFETNS